MAVAMIERPSWPNQPVRGHNPQGRDLRDRAQPDQGPVQEAIGEMAWCERRMLRRDLETFFFGTAMTRSPRRDGTCDWLAPAP